MRVKKAVSLFLSLVILVNLIPPAVYASDNNSSFSANEVITTSGQHTVYYCKTSSYLSNIYLDTLSGNGCFAIQYTNTDTYIYEYYFNIDSKKISVSSPSFWRDLFSNCVDSRDLWDKIHCPSTIIHTEPASSARLLTTDDLEAEFTPALEEALGLSEYTGRIIHTDSRDRYIFHIHEDVDFVVVEKDLYFIANTISVASLITGLFGMPITSTLLAALGLACGATVPAETEVGSHFVGANIERYVKRMDSSIWLNTTCCSISFDGYAVSSTNHYGIDLGSKTTTYTHSEAYFNDKDAQIDDGYHYLIYGA
ncbi:MAG: hypothetical protein IJW14_00115 [Oscillospiraceae bacterium]|nr:hypothetical protein [Oscillospiraceae bacterium]